MEEIATTEKITSFLSFKLGDEMFATDVSKVLEIVNLRSITKVPQTPDYMLGVINLRGNVLPVLDTRIKFGLPIPVDTVDTCIVVLHVITEGTSLVLGALVDSVEEVFELSTDDIMAPPNIGNNFKTEYLQGMVKIDESFIMILNIDKVFTQDELVVLQKTT